jgi:AP-1 complex subunit gamma-1
MGDESALPVSEETPSVAQTTHDLLADIFGSGTSDSAQASSRLNAVGSSSSSAVDDIMGLFGTNSGNVQTSSAQPVSAINAGHLGMSGVVSGSPATSALVATPAAHPVASKAQLQAYTAYDSRGLKITLTPKTSPQQPGVVQILAKFTATGSSEITNVNFQAAVPRVSLSPITLERNTLPFESRRSSFRCRQCPAAPLPFKRLRPSR